MGILQYRSHVSVGYKNYQRNFTLKPRSSICHQTLTVDKGSAADKGQNSNSIKLLAVDCLTTLCDGEATKHTLSHLLKSPKYPYVHCQYAQYSNFKSVSLPPLQEGVPLLQLLLLFLQRGDGVQQLHIEVAVQHCGGNMAGVPHRPVHYAERL